MRSRIAYVVLCVTLSMSFAEAGNYVFSGIWTGNNQQSGAPGQSCPCADSGSPGMNVTECVENTYSWNAADFGLSPETDKLPQVCYDEYVPQGAGGWAHALEYKLQTDPTKASQ